VLFAVDPDVPLECPSAIVKIVQSSGLCAVCLDLCFTLRDDHTLENNCVALVVNLGRGDIDGQPARVLGGAGNRVPRNGGQVRRSWHRTGQRDADERDGRGALQKGDHVME
jgi:hypothetical protein